MRSTTEGVRWGRWGDRARVRVLGEVEEGEWARTREATREGRSGSTAAIGREERQRRERFRTISSRSRDEGELECTFFPLFFF